MELTGRDSQVAEFKRIFDEFEMHPVNMLYISGSPGTGKTALLRELTSRATSSGALYVGATGFQDERSIPFNLIEQIICWPGIPPLISACLARLVEEGAASGSFVDASAGALRAICDSLDELPGEPRLVIGVDDVQYADPLSLQFLLYLARRSHLTRALIIVTCDTVPGEFLELSRLRKIKTTVLTEPETGLLMEREAGAAMTPDLVRSCHSISGGNPSLVKALLDDHVTAEAAAVDVGSGAGTSRLVTGDMFSRVYRSLLQRHPDLLPLANALAVLGPDATATLAARLLHRRTDALALALALDELNASGLLNGVHFRHSAARSAVLAGLSHKESRELHRRAAELLRTAGADATTLSEHYLLSEDIPDADTAMSVLCEAARQLLHAGHPQRAVACLRLADRAELTEQQQAKVVMSLANALWRINPATAEPQFSRLMTSMRAGCLSRQNTRSLLIWLLWSGRTEEAFEALDRLIATETSEGPDHSGMLDVVGDFLSVFHPGYRPRLPLPRHTGCQAVDASVAVRLEHALHIPLSQIDMSIDPEEITPLLLDHDYLIRFPSFSQGCEIDLQYLLLTALYQLHESDNLLGAARLCDIVISLAERLNATSLQAFLTCTAAEISLWRGNIARAFTQAVKALELLPESGWGVAVGWPLGMLMYTAVLSGQHEEAVHAMQQPVPEGLFQTAFGLKYLLARGHHSMLTGRPYAALGDFTTGGQLQDQWSGDTRTPRLPWHSSAAEACLHLNQFSRARELAKKELATPGCSHEHRNGIALRVLAAASEPDERLPLLKEAAQMLSKCGSRYELARVLVDLSHAHQEAGETDQANSARQRARRLAARCGVEELSPTLPSADSGGPSYASSPDQISKAELRVATLASAGKSNRQIADQLYITVSTVEQHLTRIYRKLAVQNRADLARVLGSENTVGRVGRPQRSAAARPYGRVNGGELRSVGASQMHTGVVSDGESKQVNSTVEDIRAYRRHASRP